MVKGVDLPPHGTVEISEPAASQGRRLRDQVRRKALNEALEAEVRRIKQAALSDRRRSGLPANPEKNA